MGDHLHAPLLAATTDSTMKAVAIQLLLAAWTWNQAYGEEDANANAVNEEGQRVTATGEPCMFPFEYDGEEQRDCVEFNDQEWCITRDQQWAVCRSQDGGTATNGAMLGITTDDYPVVINEVVHAPNRHSNQLDWVEFKNVGETTVDLKGFIMRDERMDRGFIFGETPECEGPGLSIIEPGEYLVLIENEDCSFDFGLHSEEEVTLFDPEERIVDHVSWERGDGPNGLSWGRIPDGSGEFVTTHLTPGEPNKKFPSARGDCCERIRSELPNFFTDLPVVVIDSRGEELTQRPIRRFSDICTCECMQPFSCDAPEPGWKNVNGYAGIRHRGSSSLNFDKKSFAVEFWDENGEKYDENWFGESRDDDWVLYGPEHDNSLLMNVLTYNLSRATGEWAPTTHFVEVFLVEDGSEELDYDKHYNGIYVAMEKVSRGPGRVDISRWDIETSPSGGYIFKYDNNNIGSHNIVFKTLYSELDMVMAYPKRRVQWADDLNPIVMYVDEFERALWGDNFADPEEGYQKYIDQDAFINYMLIAEVGKNPDSYRGSTFMHKDRNGPLAMGPLWDFNEAYGLCCGFPLRGYDTEEPDSEERRERTIGPAGWRFDVCIEENGPWCEADPIDGISRWYQRLWEDPNYRAATAEQWKKLREEELTDERLSAIVNYNVQLLSDAAERDYERWPDKLQGRTFRQEVQRLHDWLLDRVAWMDEELARHAQ